MIGEPPSEAGADQTSRMAPSVPEAASPAGAEGAVAGEGCGAGGGPGSGAGPGPGPGGGGGGVVACGVADASLDAADGPTAFTATTV